MKRRGVIYTIVILAVLLAVIVLFTQKKAKPQEEAVEKVEVVKETAKQEVKPDDVIEEAIVGGELGETESQRYIEMNSIPAMTLIENTFVEKK